MHRQLPLAEPGRRDGGGGAKVWRGKGARIEGEHNENEANTRGERQSVFALVE